MNKNIFIMLISTIVKTFQKRSTKMFITKKTKVADLIDNPNVTKKTTVLELARAAGLVKQVQKFKVLYRGPNIGEKMSKKYYANTDEFKSSLRNPHLVEVIDIVPAFSKMVDAA